MRSVQQAAASESVISEAGEQLLEEDSESVISEAGEQLLQEDSESVISEAGEQLLQEDSDSLEATRFITLQEARAYIQDLEKDRANLWKKVDSLEASLKGSK